MAEIIPFRGILYSQEKIKNFESVVAPPYDVISRSCQEELYRKSDYNIVRIILGKTLESDNDKNNRYTRAAEDLNNWLGKGGYGFKFVNYSACGFKGTKEDNERLVKTAQFVANDIQKYVTKSR